jgi:hypothetical protein
MGEIKEPASGEAEAASSSGIGQDPVAVGNYTSNISPEQARELFEGYLKQLPPSLQAEYRKFDLRKITDYLNSGGTDSGIEKLLPKLRTIDAADLRKKIYPPMPWLVPDYLPPGLTILSGRPKVGKSWLALQLAQAVMTGGKMLGKDIVKGRVLYLALEDTERRLKERMEKQRWPTIQGSVDFLLYESFYGQIGDLTRGGGKRLLKFIEANQYRIVIVDTFSRAIAGDQLDGSVMTEAIGPLQHQALELDIGLIFIDHQRKPNGNEGDPLTDLSGSTAKSGILDTSWALYKEQGKYGAKLAITGRDVNTYEFKLKFDSELFYWSLEGDAYEIDMTNRRLEILEVLKDLGPSTLTKIADKVNRDVGNTQKRLNDVCNSNLARRDEIDGKVLYSVIKK